MRISAGSCVDMHGNQTEYLL